MARCRCADAAVGGPRAGRGPTLLRGVRRAGYRAVPHLRGTAAARGPARRPQPAPGRAAADVRRRRLRGSGPVRGRRVQGARPDRAARAARRRARRCRRGRARRGGRAGHLGDVVLLVPVPSSPDAARARDTRATVELARAAAGRLRAAGAPARCWQGVRPVRRRADQTGLGAAGRAANVAASMTSAPAPTGGAAGRRRRHRDDRRDACPRRSGRCGSRARTCSAAPSSRPPPGAALSRSRESSSRSSDWSSGALVPALAWARGTHPGPWLRSRGGSGRRTTPRTSRCQPQAKRST